MSTTETFTNKCDVCGCHQHVRAQTAAGAQRAFAALGWFLLLDEREKRGEVAQLHCPGCRDRAIAGCVGTEKTG